MAGTKNDVLVGKNADFTQNAAPNASTSESNGLVINGQLWIGSTSTNAGGTHINVGTLTSPAGTIAVGYSSPNITLDLVPAAPAIESVLVQAGITTIVPSGGAISAFGGTVAAGTNPVRTFGNTNNKFTTQVQISQAIASTDATKIGLAAFDSARFSVDASGFVTLNASGAGETITGDSGAALSPSSGNWNVLGRSGSKTSGSGSTLTVNSPPFSQVGGSGTSVLNSGEFVTATATRTLPATAGLLDGDLVIYVCASANILTITANTGQTIRHGSAVTAAAGTCVSSAIGDSMSLRFNATAISWISTGSLGIWTLT